jgi:GNAT superfamily N-acetyltransferase
MSFRCCASWADNHQVGDYEIVQDSDPRCAELEAAGYRVVAESWAVRLHDPDRELLESAVRRVTAGGLVIRELGPESATALHTLEKTNEPDYPYTPATHRVVGELADVQALWPEYRVFGAFDGNRLVGATAMREHKGYGDTRFTSVLAAYRRRGVGQAVKAASILAFLDIGITRFSTGGAAANEASLQANQSLGYQLTERWRTYAP